MYSFRALFGVLLGAFLLVGCSHFESEEETAFEDVASPEQIILYQQGEREQLTEIEPIQEYNVSVSNLSNENVQVYAVDGLSPVGPALQTIERSTKAIPASGGGFAASDPSVQVFPLDDEMARTMGLMGLPSSMPMEKVQPVEKIMLEEASPVPVSLLPASEETAIQGPQQQSPPQAQDFVALNVPGNDVIRIYFDHDSSKLDEGDIGAITTAAERHAKTSGTVLSVEGHASVEANINDPIKRKIVNLRVSMDRAFTVARKLIENGVPGDMIRAAGWADTRPSEAVDGLDTVAASRRVEISSVPGQ